ncbi:unnamed protein product [Calypogeia fissa]
MASLPEELWVQILETGLQSAQLQYRDLCALAIVSRRLNRICELDVVWKHALAQDFPEPSWPGGSAEASLRRLGSDGACKKLYRTRYEKVKEKKTAAHKRQVLRVTSALNVLQRESHTLQKILRTERDKLVSSQKELENLERISRTSVALQIWQPQAVATRHEQVVQQVPVDIPAQKNYLSLEVEVCKSRIRCAENTLKSHKSIIELRIKELDALTYNPTVDVTTHKDVFGKKSGKKRKSVNIESL